MSNLKHWQEKIKEKRKNTPFKEFIKEIASFRTLSYYKNKGFTSIYPPTDRIGNVVSHKDFAENRDNFTDKGISYDSSMSFFENLKKLHSSLDFAPTTLFGECLNAEFTDQSVNIKDSYLSYVVIGDCENIFYSFSVKEGSKNVFNSLMVWNNSENIYFGTGIISSFNIFYSRYIMNCSNIWFSSNLVGCSNCMLCDGLDNKSYCIENKEYGKDEYNIKKIEILKDKGKYFQRYKDIISSSKGKNYGSKNVNGFFNVDCNDIEKGYFNYQVNKGQNIILIGGKGLGEDVYDCFLNTPPEKDFYGTFSCGYGEDIYNSYHIPFSNNIMYSYLLESCSFCIGCIGLKNKSYCILNKQYSKKDWEVLADKIFLDMEKNGTLGKFFPGELNPFYFNDTMASILGDFTKEEVVAEGYMWRDEKIKVDIPDGIEVIQIKDLGNYQGFDSNGNWQINSEILKKVIKDEKGNYYRIVDMEYNFLKKHSLPIPEVHWSDRIKLNFGV